jgi:hypothetical protein
MGQYKGLDETRVRRFEASVQEAWERNPPGRRGVSEDGEHEGACVVGNMRCTRADKIKGFMHAAVRELRADEKAEQGLVRPACRATKRWVKEDELGGLQPRLYRR